MRRALFSLTLAAVLVTVVDAAPSRAAVAASTPSPASRALEQLLSSSVPSSSRIAVQRVGGLPEHCTPTRATPLSPLDRSGPVVVDVEGDGCSARVVVEVRVLQPVLVVKQPAAVGTALAAVTAVEFRETKPYEHVVDTLPEGAVARRPLSAGRVVVDDDLALPGPDAGTPVKVVLQAGGLRVVRAAVAMPCAGAVDRRHHCARLPNGRQVHGVFAAGVLSIQETP